MFFSGALFLYGEHLLHLLYEFVMQGMLGGIGKVYAADGKPGSPSTSLA
jgi:hypothetical protein